MNRVRQRNRTGTAPRNALLGRHPDTGLPVSVTKDRTLRLKVIDACGMTCSFCHNEGTPVVVDNPDLSTGTPIAAGRSGRVSIYLGSNGARFLPTAVAPDDELASTLHLLRDALDVDELHLTGGEPTLHPRLPEITGLARGVGYSVCATSNGENGARVLPACAAAGLDRVNFSIFGTTPEELAQVQHERFSDRRRAERKLRALEDSITTAARHGIRPRANIVVPDEGHVHRVHRLLDHYSPELSVRLLNSLADGDRSTDAISSLLDSLGAEAVRIEITAGVSGWRTAYRLPSDRLIFVKQIRSVRLPETCRDCRFNNGSDCDEGYYGIRLYRDRLGGYQVGVCIQRMDLCLPVEEFVGSELCAEVVALRETEYRQLVATYAAE